MSRIKGGEKGLTVFVAVVGLLIGAGAVFLVLKHVGVQEAQSLHRLEYRFGAGENGVRWLGSGWSIPPETWGVWSIGEEASITLPSITSRKSVVQFDLVIDLFLGPKSRQTVAVAVNDRNVVSLDTDKRIANRNYKLTVPTEALSGTSPNQISFKIGFPASPEELGESGDTRKLGIAVRSLAVEYVPSVLYDCAQDVMPGNCAE